MEYFRVLLLKLSQALLDVLLYVWHHGQILPVEGDGHGGVLPQQPEGYIVLQAEEQEQQQQQQQEQQQGQEQEQAQKQEQEQTWRCSKTSLAASASCLRLKADRSGRIRPPSSCSWPWRR